MQCESHLHLANHSFAYTTLTLHTTQALRDKIKEREREEGSEEAAKRKRRAAGLDEEDERYLEGSDSEDEMYDRCVKDVEREVKQEA